MNHINHPYEDHSWSIWISFRADFLFFFRFGFVLVNAFFGVYCFSNLVNLFILHTYNRNITTTLDKLKMYYFTFAGSMKLLMVKIRDCCQILLILLGKFDWINNISSPLNYSENYGFSSDFKGNLVNWFKLS